MFILCTEVEADANTELEAVAKVQSDSQKAIDTSKELQAQLQPIRVQAEATHNSAEAALALAEGDMNVGSA